MAKAKLPNQKKAYQALDKRLVSYISQVQGIYESVAERAASLAISTDYNGSEPFSFASYSDITQAVKNLQASFVQDVQNVIYAGTSNEWKQSNQLQDLLVQKAMTYYRAQVNGVRKKQYYQTNSDVLKAFQTRTENGMNLSSKLWNQSEFMLREMEASIGAAIQKGMSATTLSKRIFKYLNDFPSLKRDFYEKYAKAADIYDCEYRTIRLARSEINIAYRLAEQTRWQQLDFILGYEIKLSGSHPVTDICDLLKGKYPKDFKWNGWHPNCFCYAVPIIMNEDEYENGKASSMDVISDVPQSYKDWCISNLNSIKIADSRNVLPYFLKDNPDFRKYFGTEYVTEYRHRTRNEEAIRLAWKNRQAMVDCGDNVSLAAFRKRAHYVGFDISEFEDFIRTTDLKYEKYGNSEIFDNALSSQLSNLHKHQSELELSYERLRKLYNSAMLNQREYKVQAVIDEIKASLGNYSRYSTTIGEVYTKKSFDDTYRSANNKLRNVARIANKANDSNIEKALGIKKGQPMSFKEADEGRANINYKVDEIEYNTNCQICVVADELRRRGFNVTALGRKEAGKIADLIAKNTDKPWFHKDTGMDVFKKRISQKGKNYIEVYNELDEITKAKGRYHIDWAWNDKDAHIVCLERRANGTLRFYDPQTGNEYDIFKILQVIDQSHTLNVLRVDNLLVKYEYLQKIVKPL